MQRRMPSLKELSTKTGKQENEIKFILNKLQEFEYIEWDGKYTFTIDILKGWVDAPPPTPSGNSYIGWH